MAFEQKLAAVSPQAFTANGTLLGVVTVASTAGFYIKQYVNLESNTLQQAAFQVKNILSTTQLILGPNNNNLQASPKNHSDLSGYLVTDGATISAPEQNNFPIPDKDHYATVFMPAPVMADRVIDVDPYGNPYGPNNPYPVSFDGTIVVGDVTVVGTGPNHYPLQPNPDGSINVDASITVPSGTIPTKWSDIELTYDINSNLTQVEYLEGATVEQILTLTYDVNGNLINVSAAD